MKKAMRQKSLIQLILLFSIIAQQLFVLPIVTINFGLDFYGSWAIAFSGAALLASMDFGFQTYFGNKFTAYCSQNEYTLATRTLQISIFIYTIIVFAALIIIITILISISILFENQNKGTFHLFVIFSMQIFIMYFNGIATYLFRAIKKYHYAVMIISAMYIAQVIMLYISILIFDDILYSAVCFVAPCLPALLVAFKMGLKRAPGVTFGLAIPSYRETSEMIRISSGYGARGLSHQLISHAPVVVIGALINAQAAAVYAAARIITGFVRQVSRQFVMHMAIEASHFYFANEPEKYAAQYRDANILFMRIISIIVGGGLVFSGVVIDFWADSTMNYDWLLMTIMFAGVLVAQLFVVPEMFLNFINKSRPVGLASWAFLAIFPPMLILSTFYLGLHGAAIAVTLSEVLIIGVFLVWFGRSEIESISFSALIPPSINSMCYFSLSYIAAYVINLAITYMFGGGLFGNFSSILIWAILALAVILFLWTGD